MSYENKHRRAEEIRTVTRADENSLVLWSFITHSARAIVLPRCHNES